MLMTEPLPAEWVADVAWFERLIAVGDVLLLRAHAIFEEWETTE